MKDLQSQKNFYGLILTVTLMGFITQNLFAAAGMPDNTFGGDGIVSTQIPGEVIGSASDVAIQPDGKIIVSVLAQGQSSNDMAVVRYNTDGTLDTSFSGDGIVNTPFGNDTDIANAVTLQTDGKILVAGTLINGQFAGSAILRLNTDGTFDTNFDGDGIVLNSLLNGTVAVAVQTDGKILVAGNSFNGNEDYFSVIRLNSNGSLDSAFGSNGKAAVSFGLIDFLSDMVLQSDGKIVLVGNADLSSSNPYPALLRFNSNGTLDNTFDGDGKVTTRIAGLGAKSVTTQPDGKILVGGSLALDSAVWRYNPNGSLDTSFDGDGIAVTSFGANSDAANDLIVQPDSKIIAAGETAIGDNLMDLDISSLTYLN